MQKHREQTAGTRASAVRRAMAMLAVPLALTSGAGRAAAQEVRPFQLTDLGGFVELGFLTDIEKRSRSGSQDSDFERVEFSQILHVNFDSYIYHPRFLTLESGFQIEGIEDVANLGNNRLLLGGDWRLNFLEKHRNSLSIFGRYLEAEFDRPFATTYSVTSQLYGTTFYQRWGWIPFDLTYQHRDEKGGVTDDLDEVSDEVIFRGNYNLGERSSGTIDYDLLFEEIYDRDVRRQSLVTTNTSYFGDQSEKRLFTNLLLEEQDDLGQMYLVSGLTNFDWQHTEDLSTRYTFDGRYNEARAQNVTNLNSTVSLRHQLYESLNTQVEFFGRLEDASFGSRTEFGGEINEKYTKWISDWGRLGISVTPRIMMTYYRPDQETALAIDERYVMRIGIPARLRRENVIASSIVVTSEDGAIEYVEGLDYDVNQVGGGLETELVLVVGGNIADGETVRVDYEYKLVGESDVLSSGVNVYAGLWVFEHVLFYGRYDTGDQDVLSGDEDALLITFYDRRVAGMELNWPWLTAKAEYENYDATFGPFEAFSGSLALFTYGRATWHARVSAGYLSRKFTDSDETVDRLRVAGRASRQMFRRGLLEVEADYLRERWSGVSGKPNDVDALYVRTAFSWWYGKIQVRLESRVAQVLRRAEDKNVYEVELRVRREF